MADGSTDRASLRSQLARLANLLLGAWLVISTFAWPHSPAQRTNTWLVGLF